MWCHLCAKGNFQQKFNPGPDNFRDCRRLYSFVQSIRVFDTSYRLRWNPLTPYICSRVQTNISATVTSDKSGQRSSELVILSPSSPNSRLNCPLRWTPVPEVDPCFLLVSPLIPSLHRCIRMGPRYLKKNSRQNFSKIGKSTSGYIGSFNKKGSKTPFFGLESMF